jgi:hypothetical protein
MCYERATDTSCVAGNRMILLDRLGETATICTNLTTTPIQESNRSCSKRSARRHVPHTKRSDNDLETFIDSGARVLI